jgi:Cu/Ag efflux pump CusA
VLAAAVVGAGVWATSAPLGVFPEFASPIVEGRPRRPARREDVEALVTTPPLERALGGMPAVAKLRRRRRSVSRS